MQRHLIARGTARLWLLVPVVSCLLAAPASAQVRNNQRGVTVFSDANYQGTNETFFGDNPDLRDVGLNDTISSIQIPRGEVWEVCQDVNFQSPCQILDRSVTNLTSLNWNDKISSIRRVQGRDVSRRGTPGYGTPGYGRNQGAGARIFADPNFGGRSETVYDVPDLATMGFNDQVSSIEIPAGQVWQVCQDWNYTNHCEVINGDVANMRSIGMNDRISSIRRLPDEEFSRRQYPNGQYGDQDSRYGFGPQITLFAEPGYRGSTRVVDQPRNFGLFGSRAASVEIRGGSWELCQRSDRPGNDCVTLNRSVPDLTRVGLTGPITSVRPVSGYGN
jgi:hypothetical protein